MKRLALVIAALIVTACNQSAAPVPTPPATSTTTVTPATPAVPSTTTTTTK